MFFFLGFFVLFRTLPRNPCFSLSDRATRTRRLMTRARGHRFGASGGASVIHANFCFRCFVFRRTGARVLSKNIVRAISSPAFVDASPPHRCVLCVFVLGSKLLPKLARFLFWLLVIVIRSAQWVRIRNVIGTKTTRETENALFASVSVCVGEASGAASLLSAGMRR